MEWDSLARPGQARPSSSMWSPPWPKQALVRVWGKRQTAPDPLTLRNPYFAAWNTDPERGSGDSPPPAEMQFWVSCSEELCRPYRYAVKSRSPGGGEWAVKFFFLVCSVTSPLPSGLGRQGFSHFIGTSLLEELLLKIKILDAQKSVLDSYPLRLPK